MCYDSFMADVLVDSSRIQKIAQIFKKRFKKNPGFAAFDFCQDPLLFPPKDHPLAADFFFTLSKHQFGFWSASKKGYKSPMWAKLRGERFKGSDFIWRKGMLLLRERPEFFTEDFQAHVRFPEFQKFFSDDTGRCPLPLMKEHFTLMRGYGKDMMRRRGSARSLIHQAEKTREPVRFLQKRLGQISGYKEDPLSKKANMLIMILMNRPEPLLKVPKNQDVDPIVDYHIQRLSLRTGIVQVKDEILRKKLVSRRFVTRREEQTLRQTTYQALKKLKKVSGATIAVIDYLFFSARKWCPEMERPDCPNCRLKDFCEKNTELFQPILRTTFY